MMSSSLSQGLQSCLEPRIVEPLVLQLKMASRSPELLGEPDSDITQNQNITAETAPDPSNAVITAINCHNYHQTTLAGVGFPELANIGSCREGVYVHPLENRSLPTVLSEKSLEMCTEILGSESGSTGISIDDISIAADGVEQPPKEHQQRNRRNLLSRKRVSHSKSFPPPLTTITESKRVWMRPHRAGGRLMLEAVTTSCRQNYFHVERSKGQLKMRLWTEKEDYHDMPEFGGPEGADKPENYKENCNNAPVETGNNSEKSGTGWLRRCKECGPGQPDKGLLHHLEPVLVAT